MSEIEKKFSDYQKSECETLLTEDQVIDEKLCPTCVPNPNFTLSDDWWNINDAYLNESVCEYHVTVKQSELKLYSESEGRFEIGIKKILSDFNKPLNNAILTQLKNAAYQRDRIVDTGIPLSYLIAVPAFNFDQIENNNSENAEQNDNERITPPQEIIINYEGFSNKLLQLVSVTRLFGFYYSEVQNKGSESFVIREKQNIVNRINYKSTADQIIAFRSALSDLLVANEFPRIGFTGSFKPKRVKRIKFVFKESDTPFDLESVWVWAENGCGNYEQLESLAQYDSNRSLRGSPVVYGFLSNLDEVISDLSAKETMPWTEWTTKHFYPKYIIDYGDIDEMDNAKQGFECLLEEQLGLGEGQVVDYLSKEFTSAFKLFEKEANRSACRDINDRVSEGETARADADRLQKITDGELKQRNYVKKIQKKYKARIEKALVRNLKTVYNFSDVKKKNLYDETFNILDVYFSIPTDYQNKTFVLDLEEDNPNKIRRASIELKKGKFSEENIDAMAMTLAIQDARDAFDGSLDALDDNAMSPYKILGKEARKEVLDDFSSEFIDGYKDTIKGGRKDGFDLLDIIPSLGLCGITKTAGKMIKCITNGVSYDDFLDILLEKSIDFMQVNTFSLLLNNLPYGIREDINAGIEQEFGEGVDLSSLLGIIAVDGSEQQMRTFLRTKKNRNQAYDILIKTVGDNKKKPTPEELRFLESVFGKYNPNDREHGINIFNDFYTKYRKAEDNDGKIIFGGNARTERYYKKEKERNYKKVYKKIIKTEIKKYKKTTSNWAAAKDRFTSQLESYRNRGETQAERYEASLNEFEAASKNFKETKFGVKVDAVFDIVLDSTIDYLFQSSNADELYGIIQKYPAADFAFDAVLKSLTSPCPTAPLYYPPPTDFLKSLTVDICNPTFQLQVPKLNIPNLSWRYNIKRKYSKAFSAALTKLFQESITRLLIKILSTIESALCNFLEGGVSAAIGLGDGFIDALNEAFCNDGENAETARKKAEELADALFGPVSFDPNQNFEGSGRKTANVLAAVSSKDEMLAAMVARDGEENDKFNKRVSNAINSLAPEMSALLGSPNQVAYFFRNLGSYLDDDDRERIRDLLDAGIPNLPVSDAICLTNEQLEDWNRLRENLLSAYPNPREIVNDLNQRTQDALDELMDDVGEIETDGPFVGALADEILKDVCNKNNILNDLSQSDISQEAEDDLTNAFFANISTSLTRGFVGRNGIIGEALKDREGRNEFRRSFFKFFNPNYQNSQSERDSEYESRGLAGKFLMDALTDGGIANGVYPETVAIKQREDLLSEEGQEYGGSISFKFADEEGGSSYYQDVSVGNVPKSFDYQLTINEEIDNDLSIEHDFIVPVEISDLENEHMKSFGFQYEVSNEIIARKAAFDQKLKYVSGLNINFGDLFNDVVEQTNKNLITELLSSGSGPTIGYQFGYVNDDIAPDDFNNYLNPDGTPYDKDEEEKILGKFANPRIIALDPAFYGGRYSRPMYTTEMRQFTGWVEIATKAFDSSEGCDPKKPPLISFNDIAERTKFLGSSIRNDPRLSQDPECVTVKPFEFLADSKIIAKMDGVVRTTIRTYVAEYFLKGYGLFSNINFRDENFDTAVMQYFISKMKEEMSDLGPTANNRRVRITRERYWYSFLEQACEAYMRMIDVDNIEPPNEVSEAISTIRKALDQFRLIGKNSKAQMRRNLSAGQEPRRPNSLEEARSIVNDSYRTALHAIAFRIASFDERENFFDNGLIDINANDIRFSSLKKLRFFQKIYFIRLFEKEATLIMSELLKDEFNRFNEILVNGLYDKPQYYDLYKSFFGMSSFFPKSSSKVGLNSFYIDKQRTKSPDIGSVPSVLNNNTIAPIEATDKPQLIVESYVTMSPRDSEDTPDFIRFRNPSLSGKVSLTNFSNFLSNNSEALSGKNISDYFGNLSFTYKGTVKQLLDKGFTDTESINRLVSLNEGTLLQTSIRSALNSFISLQDFEDFEVVYDDYFVLEGETPEPFGVTGETGINYGLRVSMVLPKNYLNQNQLETFKNLNIDRSAFEKSFYFEDGTIILPLAEQEISVIDAEFDRIEQYDLECLINKLVQSPDFTLMFDKILGFRRASSMLAIYCIETFMPSIGKGPNEREEDQVESNEDAWEGTINQFGKNFLRREFKSLYLSRTRDGQSVDVGDTPFGSILGIGNPFNSFRSTSVRVPWWTKRRMKLKVYDANGQECANPKKDLR